MNRLITGICLIALMMTPGHLLAQKKSLPEWPLDFENVIPGDPPLGWARSWGEQGDDLFLISNERAVSGTNSLLLDRLSGTNEAQWGFSTKTPVIRSGWAVLSFCVLGQGAGTDLMFGFELRDAKNTRSNMFTIAPRKMKWHLSAEGVKKPPAIGDFKIDTWQRITVWLPTVEGRQNQAFASIENLVDKQWQSAGGPISINVQPVSAPIETFLISTYPQRRNYKVFFDDFHMESRTSAPK